MKYSIIAVIGVAQSIKVSTIPSDELTRKNEVYPPHLHWNEDPHSVPTPLVNKAYLTSTQARFVSQNSTANIESREPVGALPWHYNYGAYNDEATEYGRNTLERNYETREIQYLQLDSEVQA